MEFMKVVTTEELTKYKILPFDIYSEYGERIFESGEILTPGKLMQLKNLDKLFRDDDFTLDILPEPEEKEEEKEKTSKKHSKKEKKRRKNKIK